MYGAGEDAEAEKKAETTALFDMLCDRLDALSNFNFKPKMVKHKRSVWALW